MRAHLATLLDDLRKHEREIAIVRYKGVRRQVTTYGELARMAGRFAALLEDRGIGVGDRVLLWGENGAEWVAAFYGCMLRGVMAVPLDEFGSAQFAARVAADVKPKLATGDLALLAKLTRPGNREQGIGSNEPASEDRGPASSDVPVLAFEEWGTSLPAREAGAITGLSLETPLQILFTSGTTGDPKGIVHTHGNVLASVAPIEEAAQKYLRYERYVHPLRILHTLPLSHVFGQTMGLWIPPIFAAEVHFETRLVAPRLVDTIKRERISVLAAVPRVMALLMTHLEHTKPGLARRVAASKGIKAWKRWWVFRDVHRTLGLQVLGIDFGRRCARRSAGAVLECAWIRRGAGLRHDGDNGADHTESSVSRGERHNRQAAAGTGSEDRSGRRSDGEGSDDFDRNLERRRAEASQRRLAGNGRPGRETGNRRVAFYGPQERDNRHRRRSQRASRRPGSRTRRTARNRGQCCRGR